MKLLNVHLVYPLYEQNGKISVLLRDKSLSGSDGIKLTKIESDGAFDPGFNSGIPLALPIESDQKYEFHAADLRFDDAFYIFASRTSSTFHPRPTRFGGQIRQRARGAISRNLSARVQK